MMQHHDDAFEEQRCSHMHEPGCAIKGAVVGGYVTEQRYQGYLRMQPKGGAPSKRHR